MQQQNLRVNSFDEVEKVRHFKEEDRLEQDAEAQYHAKLMARITSDSTSPLNVEGGSIAHSGSLAKMRGN